MKRKIKCEGKLNLNGNEVSCYVLEDKTRAVSTTGIGAALDVTEKEIKLFFTKNTVPIKCYNGNIETHVLEAIALVELFDSILEARKSDKLTEKQKLVAEKCETIMRTFAKTGIIPLIDQATKHGQMELKNKEFKEKEADKIGNKFNTTLKALLTVPNPNKDKKQKNKKG